jgi:hypothetical protein
MYFLPDNSGDHDAAKCGVHSSRTRRLEMTEPTAASSLRLPKIDEMRLVAADAGVASKAASAASTLWTPKLGATSLERTFSPLIMSFVSARKIAPDISASKPACTCLLAILALANEGLTSMNHGSSQRAGITFYDS